MLKRELKRKTLCNTSMKHHLQYLSHSQTQCPCRLDHVRSILPALELLLHESQREQLKYRQNGSNVIYLYALCIFTLVTSKTFFITQVNANSIAYRVQFASQDCLESIAWYLSLLKMNNKWYLGSVSKQGTRSSYGSHF